MKIYLTPKGTSHVRPYDFHYDGYDIVLIDTPGFNDTLRSETEVLKDIAGWLDYTFRNPPKIKLNGIIYMQAITDRRMYGSTLRNLRMFRELCGDNPMKNVVFVTTGWGNARTTGEYEKAVNNERDLCESETFWKPMIRKQSRVDRFEDTRESALKIIMSLIDHEPLLLQIQKELVEENMTLINTGAGHVVNEELKKLEEKYKKELADVQKEMAEAMAQRDVEWQESLEASQKEIERLRDDARKAQDELLYKSRNDARRAEALQNELFDMRNDMERMRAQQQIEHQKQLDGALADQRRQFEQSQMQMRAEQIEQQMKFDEIVKQLRANEQMIREEERRILEARITEVERQYAGRRDNIGAGSRLLTMLGEALGGVAMGALGFPLLPFNPFSGLF